MPHVNVCHYSYVFSLIDLMKKNLILHMEIEYYGLWSMDIQCKGAQTHFHYITYAIGKEDLFTDFS